MGVNIGNKELKDAYIGDKPIKKIYLGDKLLWQKVPYDAEIEYLESDGNQWIGLPLIANVGQSLSFEGEMIPRYKNGVTVYYYTFQTTPTNQFSGFFYSKDTKTNKITYASYSGNDTAYGSWGCGTEIDKKGNFIISTQGKTNPSNGEYQELVRPLNRNVKTFYLFGGYDSNRCPICYGKIKIKVNDGVVYDMIPVRIGQVGYMYDKVSGQLFENSGTGNFILGNDI